MKHLDEQHEGNLSIEPTLPRWRVDNFRLQEQFYKLQAEFQLLSQILGKIRTSEDPSDFADRILSRREHFYCILQSYVYDDYFVCKLFSVCEMSEWEELNDLIFDIIKQEEEYLKFVLADLIHEPYSVLPEEIIECSILKEKIDNIGITIQNIFDVQREMSKFDGRCIICLGKEMDVV